MRLTIMISYNLNNIFFYFEHNMKFLLRDILTTHSSIIKYKLFVGFVTGVVNFSKFGQSIEIRYNIMTKGFCWLECCNLDMLCIIMCTVPMPRRII